jgi:CBS-domain-containing membrane protein
MMYDGRPIRYAVVSWIGSFTGILSIFALTYAFEQIPILKEYWISDNWVVAAAGAFGAQSVLVFALPSSPASQPWNCVFGSMVSAFIGVSTRKLFVVMQQLACSEDDLGCYAETVQPNLALIASALANSISIVVMHLTDSIHPPAGAFAYIAVNAAGKIRSLGYFYMILPVGIGSVWFVMLSWFVNKYVNMMADHLFSVKHEQDKQMEMTDGKKNQGYELDKNEGATSQNPTKCEEGLAKTKTLAIPSKLTNRKYPTGDGIGAWIRPLRKKQ